ncbi:glycosyltransferase [Leptolyngbya ohadii]|uniref:glycosyltransferase n=1 Tax=Leptolyngbya ohadii TaxID=1962290 RepID=UPI000B598DA2|nr:glycosyltransferase [Leptolyngbya ohadii]
MPNPPRIHLWTPGLFDFKGGIQTYSSFLLQALEQIDPSLQIDVFLLHDRDRKGSEAFRSRFHCTGHIPARLRIAAFAANAIVAAIQQRPDLIISTHLNFTIAADWVKRVAGIPYWSVAHGFEAWDVQRPNLRRSIACADQILAVSRYTRDRLLQEQSLYPGQVSLLPNTFAAERFQIAPKPVHLLHRYSLTADQPIILTVNRLAAGEAYHPYDRVLVALPQIRQVIPNAHYLIVGAGDDRPRLEQLIAASQLQSCVTLTGFVPDEKLPDYYSLCDVFAMPSKLEGFGIVFLEAMASGKPVLGSRCDGSTDALAQGKLGALVDPDDTEAIAQTLIQILRKSYAHPLMYQPEALRQAVIEAFGMEIFKQTLQQLLNSRFYSQVSPWFSKDISIKTFL